MKLWIVTIGSSDVQLDSDKVSREKKRKAEEYSADVWGYWYNEKIQYDFCNGMLFEPKRVIDTLEETYRIPSRVLGTVYEENSAEVQDEIWSYLTFPLLSNFIESKEESKEKSKILDGLGAIVYLLTDQSAIFDSDEECRKPKSPYWDDTCKLEPILQRYFEKEFPGVKLIALKLSPAEKPGLDDWDKVLGLVKDELNKIKLDSEPDTVYVSHQAGTPAISSAVQFMSLARFREDVKFLVSSEYSQETKTIHNSTYLGALQRQEAIALLEQHDYAAVKSLLNDYLDSQTQILLDAAIQWNYAKFDDFATELQNLSNEKFEEIVKEVNERTKALINDVNAPTKEKNWWWTAYEAAYLAAIRLKQGNTVEAFFHSFRAFEGIFAEWGNHEFAGYVEIKKKDIPWLSRSIIEHPKNYFSKAKFKQDGQPKDDLAKLKSKIEKEDGLELELMSLCKLFRSHRSEYKEQCPNLKIFWDCNGGISQKRNLIFHQLQGVSEQNLWDFWAVDSLEEWKSQILKFLNFISEQSFDSLANASLMSKVHEKLVNTIASYQPE